MRGNISGRRGAPREYQEVGIPITIYCTVKKRPVLIFSSQKIATQYLYDNENMGYISGALRHRGRIGTHVFAPKILAVRAANSEQAKMLKGEKYIVLDSDFKRKSIFNI